MAQKKLPLCVDLDGTLIRTDVVQESLVLLLKEKPWVLFLLLFWLLKGRAYLKKRLAEFVTLNIPSLPVNQEFFHYLKQQKAHRPLYLVTASDIKPSTMIAHHFKVFDAVIASDGIINLRSENKAKALQERFGSKGFIYAGNSRHDLPVWAAAAEALAVNTPHGVLEKLKTLNIKTTVFDPHKDFWRLLLKTFHFREWAFNFLIFVPFFLHAHSHDLGLFLLGFLALTALVTELDILKDLLTLEESRKKSLNQQTPLAHGDLLIATGIRTLLCLFLIHSLLLISLPGHFIFVQVLYGLIFTLHALYSKQKLWSKSLGAILLWGLRLFAGYALLSGFLFE